MSTTPARGPRRGASKQDVRFPFTHGKPEAQRERLPWSKCQDVSPALPPPAHAGSFPAAMHVESCMRPPTVQPLFPPGLWSCCTQGPLACNPKCSGGSSQCWIPRLGNLTWGLEGSLLWGNCCNTVIFQPAGSPPFRIVYVTKASLLPPRRGFIFVLGCRTASSSSSFFFLIYFRATPAAYGGSQARGQTGAVASGLHQGHSNAGSEPSLQPTPQLKATADP